MKAKFSTSWISSKQARKQRKYRHNAPLHVMHKFLNATLSKSLRKTYDKRSATLRKRDEVLIMRGNFAKKKGKILEVNLKKKKVSIDGVNRTKRDGTKVNVLIDPSNIQILEINLEDARRLKRTKREIKPTEKETKDAPQKITN